MLEINAISFTNTPPLMPLAPNEPLGTLTEENNANPDKIAKLVILDKISTDKNNVNQERKDSRVTLNRTGIHDTPPRETATGVTEIVTKTGIETVKDATNRSEMGKAIEVTQDVTDKKEGTGVKAGGTKETPDKNGETKTAPPLNLLLPASRENRIPSCARCP